MAKSTVNIGELAEGLADAIGGPVSICVGKGEDKRCFARQYGKGVPKTKTKPKGASYSTKGSKKAKKGTRKGDTAAAQAQRTKFSKAAGKCKGKGKNFQSCMKKELKG